MIEKGRTKAPPSGWLTFGSHADGECPHHTGALTFSSEKGEDGLPLWEMHDDCHLVAPIPERTQNWWRQRGTTVEIHLIEAMENVERLLRFVDKIAHDPSCPQHREARAILKDFGRLNDDGQPRGY